MSPICGGLGASPEAVTRMLASLGPLTHALDPARGVTRVEDRDAPNASVAAWIEDDTLHLTRDPIGHRSLYWTRTASGAVLFATTIRALVASGEVPLCVSPHSLALYLSCAYVPGAHTLIEGVFALRGGEHLTATRASVASHSEWTLPASPSAYEPEETLRVRLRAELERAVQDRLPPPGAPVGASLSGGIDSSAVVALIHLLHDGPLDTYSVWFGPAHAHELDFSRAMAAHVNAPHHVVEVRPEHVMAELDRTVAALGEPNGDPLTVPNSLIFRAAAARAPLLFNGEGGDPCFGGPKNAPMLLATLFSDRASAAEADYLRAHQRCWDELDVVLHPALRARVPPGSLEAEITPYLADRRWSGLLDRLMAINVTWKGAHHILPKVDRLAFVEGVTPRSPLFERRLVELAFAIPGVLKRKGAEEKWLLKRAVEELLPRAIVDRPKSGMMVPVEAWFDGPLRAWARERLLEGLTGWELLSPEYLAALVDGPRRGLRPRRGIKIWLLLTLESWLRALRPM